MFRFETSNKYNKAFYMKLSKLTAIIGFDTHRTLSLDHHLESLIISRVDSRVDP